ncbi:MAG: TlpA family protein disulfide reductase [Thermoleophilia bacterium]
MRPRRALAALALAGATAVLAAGCFGGGGDEASDVPAGTAPAAVAAPVAVAAVPPGGTVSAGPNTPKDVARALAGSRVVVIAFLVKGPADDARVAASLRAVEADRTSRDVEFFTYRVGKDKFGDLADLLGVTGTPSIAVIGRDRVLANLWTGLTDAEILRQSISDAADTAAANRGAAAATAPSGGPAGDPDGIALARRTSAAYDDVPGLRVSGTVQVDGADTMTMDAEVRLSGGKIDAMSGSFSAAGARFDLVGSASAVSFRGKDASCWVALPAGAAQAAAAPETAVTVPAGARVGAPRAEGPNQLLDVTLNGETITYVIDRASGELREVRADGIALTYEAMETAPEIPAAEPVCDNPADALEGLPAAFGGTS